MMEEGEQTNAAFFLGRLYRCLTRLFTTLTLLFTAGLSTDRYAMEFEFPALLGCWGVVYLRLG